MPAVKDNGPSGAGEVGQSAFSLAPFALVAVGLAAIRLIKETRAQTDTTTMSGWLILL